MRDGVGEIPINKTTAIHGVPESLWSVRIGGYQVLHKWIDSRKRAKHSLSDDALMEFARIVSALSESKKLMQMIDGNIDKAGGWLEAFSN